MCINSILMDKLPEFAAIWLDSSLSIIYVRWVDALDVENNNLGFKIAIDFYQKKIAIDILIHFFLQKYIMLTAGEW